MVLLALLVLGSTGWASAGPLNPLDFASLGAFPTAMGTYTINTSGTPTLTEPDGTTLTGVISNGIAVFDFDSINVLGPIPSRIFTATGSLPLALLSRTDATIAGLIDVSGQNGAPSQAAPPRCPRRPRRRQRGVSSFHSRWRPRRRRGSWEALQRQRRHRRSWRCWSRPPRSSWRPRRCLVRGPRATPPRRQRWWRDRDRRRRFSDHQREHHLVEPDLGAADSGTDSLDGSAGEAQGNSAMTGGKFVVPGYLRVTAGGGCPRG